MYFLRQGELMLEYNGINTQIYISLVTVCIVLLGLLYVKNRLVDNIVPSDHLITYLYINSFMLMASDIGWVFVEQGGNLSPAVVFFMCFLWYVFFIMAAFLWFLICNMQLNGFKIKTRFGIFMAFLPAVAVMGLLASSWWNGSIFSVSESGCYQRGPLFFVAYLVAFFYNIAAVVMCFLNAHNERGAQRNDSISLAFIPMPYLFTLCFQMATGFEYSFIGILASLSCYDVDYQRRDRRIKEQLNEALRIEQANIQMAQSLLNMAFWTMSFDETGKIDDVSLNPDFWCLLGFEDPTKFQRSREEWVNRLHPDDRERVLSAYNAALNDYSGNTPYNVEYRLLTKDNLYKWFSAKAKITRRSNGTPEFFSGLVRDINDRKEREIMEFAKKQAEAANEAKTVFLFNMSHDIRTPMNAITGFAAMAKKHFDDKKLVSDCIEKIDVAGQHLLRLINDVLDMARIESGNINIEEARADIIERAEAICAICSQDAYNKGIKLSLHHEGVNDRFVIADEMHINQIIMNVLSNAIKFTDAGGSVDYTIKQLNERSDGSTEYLFSIEDTGIGMSQEFVEKIFDAFSRERTSTVSGIEGTGMGMSIVKKLVDMLNGSIKVSSAIGKGTKVDIVLPLYVVEPDEIVEEIDEDSDSDFKGLRVLLAEDNEMNREIAKTILEDKQIMVEEAEDGDIAVQMVRDAEEGYYDLILMDIQMPRMDGLEASRQIRNLPDKKGQKIPIIALTANAFEDDQKKSMAAGMDAHLAKPIDVDALFKTIKHYVQRPKQISLFN